MRQLLVLVAAALAFYLPFLVVDLARRADGLPFYVNGGRYLLPAYAAVVVAFLAGICELMRRDGAAVRVHRDRGHRPRLRGLGLLEVGSAFFIGREDIGELFRRMTFNRPAFVTQGFVWVLASATVLSLIGFAATLWPSRASAAGPPAPAPP